MVKSNEERIVKSLETIAECMLKSNKMAGEATKKNRELHEANMAMIRERYDKEEKLDKELLKSKTDSIMMYSDEPVKLTEEQLKSIDDEEDDDMPFQKEKRRS